MDDGPRSFDERAMWASIALELLAKAALANHSPILIADPNDDTSLLGASGLVRAEGSFKSVTAVTLYRRCRRAFRPFDEKKAEIFANARNDYLHGSGIVFGAIPETVWWADFWSLVSPLVDAQDKSIEDLVGERRTQVVLDHLENNQKYVSERVESLLGRARVRFEDKKTGRMSAARTNQWKSEYDLRLGLRYSTGCDCPACGQSGLLEAEDVENMRIEPGYYDHYEARGLADALADYFVCEHCQLVLDRYDFIEAAGIDPAFEVEDPDFIEKVAAETEYGNE